MTENTDAPEDIRYRIEEALALAFTSGNGDKNPHWDIEGPDDETNPYMLPAPLEERISQPPYIAFTAADGHRSIRIPTIRELGEIIEQVLREEGT